MSVNDKSSEVVYCGQKMGVLFFKQKTAYEVVSRDWSSDVCSSDLIIRLVPQASCVKLKESIVV